MSYLRYLSRPLGYFFLPINKVRLALTLALLFCVALVQAAIEIHEFSNEVDRLRYENFIDEMRCPKCQNQNLAGSDSPIASDLRRELYLQIKEGKSDKEIVDFMVGRYGEFILYKPRLSPATLLLWGLPIALLLLGAVVLMLIIRRRRVQLQPDTQLSAEERDRLTRLLQPSGGDTQANKDAQL